PPAAADQSYTTTENEALNVSAGGLLQGASDPDGDFLTAALVAGPAHGTVTLNPDGSFTYTPAQGFGGADSFTFVANDGLLNSNVATAHIFVNSPPTAANQAFSVNENQTLAVNAATGLLTGAGDPDGDSLTAAVVAAPTHGKLTLHADGSFVYTPTQFF